MRQHRPDHVLERAEFLSRARSMARRGVALTHSKLTLAEVQEKYDVHPRTIEKVLSYETWSHIK